MDSWDEVRTAWQVARLGTVSGAAEVLGVHHATVIRHIDALERRLGVKLFQRHARGYTPTEAGRDLLSVAEDTADRFGQLSARIKGGGAEIAGDLVVTAVMGMSAMVTPALMAFQQAHPNVVVRFLTDSRVFRLEYGEAHLAIRAGAVPEDPDNVVQPLGYLRTGLYASRSYAAAHGLPRGPDDFAGHRFIGVEGDSARAPFNRWMAEHVKSDQIIWRVTETAAMKDALLAGAGIGFATAHLADADDSLIQVMPPQTEWDAPLWLVTHVDLHRTPKVQSCLGFLKAAAAKWATL
ncbi:MAG: LysR family transcriptional regulator [Gemmobacter sp.]|nr:LysR family transcriptional regulator [Gemmobacter sp.]